jgi:hypothetical protein
MRAKAITIGLAVIMVVTIFAAVVPVSVGESSSRGARGGGYNILVTEAGINVVNEYDTNGNLVWQYNNFLSFALNDAERLENGNTLIADMFADQIFEVDPSGAIVWSHFTNMLDVPMDAERLDSGNTLFVKTFGGMMGQMGAYEIHPGGGTVWSTPAFTPVDVERLANGNTLITELGPNRVAEVNSAGKLIWQCMFGLNSPVDAERLDNGNTLITNSFGNNVIEVNSIGQTVWQYSTGLNFPYDAERLDNGNTVIADYSNSRVIEVDSSGNIVWQIRGLRGPVDVEVLGSSIPADVRLEPQSLNLDSNGNWMNVKVEGFPDNPEYTPMDVDGNTVKVAGADTNLKFGTWNDNKYIGKVDRLAVEDSIGTPGEEIEVSITGNLNDGTAFEGTAIIKAIRN